jgi:DNA-binding HxlR family transcriptional regulator
LGFNVLAKKGVREILQALADKKGTNFTEIQELVGSPTTASQRLQELTGLGILKREVQADRFRSVKYSLTEKGIKVVKLVKELEKAVLG